MATLAITGFTINPPTMSGPFGRLTISVNYTVTYIAADRGKRFYVNLTLLGLDHRLRIAPAPAHTLINETYVDGHPQHSQIIGGNLISVNDDGFAGRTIPYHFVNVDIQLYAVDEDKPGDVFQGLGIDGGVNGMDELFVRGTIAEATLGTTLQSIDSTVQQFNYNYIPIIFKPIITKPSAV